VIALFIALFKKAKEQLLFLSLFLKEQKSDSSFGCSFEKSGQFIIVAKISCICCFNLIWKTALLARCFPF